MKKSAWLKAEHLIEAIAAENSQDLVIAGTIDLQLQSLTIWRGSGASLTVPLECFETSGNGLDPDFTRFSIGDYGTTLLFGDYEATVESILFEYDPDFRQRYENNLR